MPIADEKRSVHVIPSTGGWAVRSTGSSRAVKVVPTQSAAIKEAHSLARGGKIFVHDRDGRIIETRNFSSDRE